MELHPAGTIEQITRQKKYLNLINNLARLCIDKINSSVNFPDISSEAPQLFLIRRQSKYSIWGATGKWPLDMAEQALLKSFMARELICRPEPWAAGVIPKKTKPPDGGFALQSERPANYMRSIIASPKAEHDSSSAPSIRRAKS
jgi:hypothetical protein